MAPGWLEAGLIDPACGGRSRAERRAALRAYTETPLRQGKIDSPWDRLIVGAVLGEVAYARALLREAKAAPDERAETRALARVEKVLWQRIGAAAEGLAGRNWEVIRELHGDWIRDGTVFVAVRYLGYRLAEVYGHEPGWRDQAAAQAVRRFAEKLKDDPARQKFVTDLRRCAQEH